MAWKDVVVPKPYPREFRDDVVRVARNREPDVTIERIAKDFGVHTMTLQEWLQRAAVDDGAKPGQSRTASGSDHRTSPLIDQLHKSCAL